MFRFVTSQSLKTRVATQVTSRSTLPTQSQNFNHRFHTSTSSENANVGAEGARGAQVPKGNFNNKVNYKRENFDNRRINEGKSGFNNKKNNRRSNEMKVDVNSPFFQQFAAFDECLTHTATIDRYMKLSNPSIPTFWSSIGRVMPLYRELTGMKEFDATRVSKLVHLLHTGLRLNRKETASLGRKPDYDSKNFNREMHIFLAAALREIANDILQSKTQVNAFGLLHLITSFDEMGLKDEAIAIWISGKERLDSSAFLDSRIVGAVIPIGFTTGKFSYEECVSLYTSATEIENSPHPNLLVGMLKVSLKADKVEEALDLFAALTKSSDHRGSGYNLESHLCFIADCTEMSVADTFFQKALQNQMPYNVELQVPVVKSYMQNTVNMKNDFEKVTEIWIKTIGYYEKKGISSPGIFGSLNDDFISHFFRFYPEFTDVAFSKLKQIISSYNSVRIVDEAFLNSILSKCDVWNSGEVVEAVYEAFDAYQIPRSSISHRIYLKSHGFLDVSNEKILQQWNELLLLNDSHGYKFIAAADWSALKDATVRSQEYGAQRTDFYYRVFKKFSQFSKDKKQYVGMIRKDSSEIPGSVEAYSNLARYDDSEIVVPDFKSISAFVTEGSY